ncbi:MAG: hypothetical protein JEZ08_24145 [Clostridiales bacterium]|nr:hypothetical protein [Clostridiales bacterium]
MTLKELVQLCEFDRFFKELLTNYTEINEDSMERVQRGFKDLQTLEVSDTKEQFEIQVDFIEDENYYDVSGKKPDDEDLYSLMLIDWKDWLTFTVEESIFQKWMPEEVLAHIYWEMTWDGFTYEETKESQLVAELEASYIAALETLIGELKYKKTIEIKDLKEYIEKYQNTDSKDVKLAIEFSLEELVREKDLSVEVQLYLEEILENEDLKQLLKDKNKNE